MPKRMLDSSYLNSPSLDRCSPRAQDNFPRFILLADDFGCFEVDTRRLLALGWTSKRIDVTEADIWAWLEEYVAAGMACLWTVNERQFCYLTGWDGEHGQRKREEYNPNAPKGTPAAHGSKRQTPKPPADLVAAVLAGERRVHDGKPPGTIRECGGAAENPPGKPQNTIPNKITPAREIRGSAADIRGSAAAPPNSAAPVPDPVPVPVPGSCAELPKTAAPTPDEDAQRPLLEVIDHQPQAPEHPASPVVAVLPCVGKGPKEFPVTEALIAEWQASYPGVEVRREVLRAVQWCRDRPKKQKTFTGARAFFGNWMAKEQNGGVRNGGSSPSAFQALPPPSPKEEFVGGERDMSHWIMGGSVK